MGVEVTHHRTPDTRSGRTVRPAWKLVAVAAVLMFALPVSSLPAWAAASKPDCKADRCGLHADGPYPDYVVGTVAHIGTDADMRRVFDWTRHHGYWKALPDTLAPYLKDVELVTIALPPAVARRPITVFVTHEEFAVSPYRIGDLVRYSPHGADHEAPPRPDRDDGLLFHGLTGCVALLCRAGDRACVRRYVEGVFTKADGRQVDLATGKVIPGGLRIDPVSMLPMH